MTNSGKLEDSVQLGVETGRNVVLVYVPPLGFMILSVLGVVYKESWLCFREMLRNSVVAALRNLECVVIGIFGVGDDWLLEVVGFPLILVVIEGGGPVLTADG